MSTQDYLGQIQSATAGDKAAMDSAGANYAQYANAAATLPQKLKEALNTKLGNNKDLINQQQTAQADYFAAPAEARQTYSNVWDPTAREALVSRDVANKQSLFDAFGQLLNNRVGTVNDIVSTGVSGFNGLLTGAKGLADLASTKYTNTLNEFLKAAGMQDTADQLALSKEKAKDTGSSTSMGSDFSTLLASILGGGTSATVNNMPKEPKPTQTPSNPNVHWQSPQGEWEYNWQYKSWVPSGSEVTG